MHIHGEQPDQATDSCILRLSLVIYAPVNYAAIGSDEGFGFKPPP